MYYRKDIVLLKQLEDDFDLTQLPNWLSLARTSSNHSDYKIKVGSVLVKHNRVLAIGFNRSKTHPKSARHAVTIHAEHSALIVANGANLQGATVFVYRATANGKPALAKPCSNCCKLLVKQGVKRMVYTVPEYPYFAIAKF